MNSLFGDHDTNRAFNAFACSHIGLRSLFGDSHVIVWKDFRFLMVVLNFVFIFGVFAVFVLFSFSLLFVLISLSKKFSDLQIF